MGRRGRSCIDSGYATAHIGSIAYRPLRTIRRDTVKIVDMIVTPVAMADAPLRNAPGIHEPYANRVIVELVGEDGNSGFGEAAYSTRLHDDLQALRASIVGGDA